MALVKVTLAPGAVSAIDGPPGPDNVFCAFM